jgi:phospho-N-acetylmuramoyl-pentapeptide-transferase
LWGAKTVGIFAGALAGALVGFLLFNFHPAKVFMGDTGSLFLGGAVCALAFATDMPLILVPLGIVYLVETLSDIIQVVYFKLTHGKRVFRMAPLHHHFEMCGWSEKKVFTVFTAVSATFAVLSYFAVSQRYSI